MDLGVECLAELAGGAGEFNGGSALSNSGNREALLLEPGLDAGDVSGGWTILLAELRGREPMVILLSSGRVGVVEELVERVLLLRGSAQQEKNALRGKGVRNRSLIEAGLRELRNISGNRDERAGAERSLGWA